MNLQVHRLACAPGTVWDDVHLTCNWPDQVPGCDNQVEEEGSEVEGKEENTAEEEDEEKQQEKEGARPYTSRAGYSKPPPKKRAVLHHVESLVV